MTPPFFLDRTLGHFDAIENLMKHVSKKIQRLNSNANVSSLGQSKYHHNPISEERLNIKELILCTWCYLT
jgi:predicted urease superfamily metal-dependent hydrolase